MCKALSGCYLPTRSTWTATATATAASPDAVGEAQAAIIALYTTPPAATIVICADELGPVTPRTFPPPPGWTTNGHRVKAPLVYDRSPP
jgi:hypothetical protein